MTNYDSTTIRYDIGSGVFESLSTPRYSAALSDEFMRYVGALVYWTGASQSGGVKLSVESDGEVLPSTQRTGIGTSGQFAVNIDRDTLPSNIRLRVESILEEDVIGGFTVVRGGLLDATEEPGTIEKIELLRP